MTSTVIRILISLACSTDEECVHGQECTNKGHCSGKLKLQAYSESQSTYIYELKYLHGSTMKTIYVDSFGIASFGEEPRRSENSKTWMP